MPDEGFRAFVEVAPDAIVIVDDRGKIVSINRLAEDMFGYTRAELIGKDLETLVPDRHSGRRKDGSEFPAEISRSLFRTAEGAQTISIIRDITAQKQAQARFRNLLESAPDGIVVVDSSGSIAIVNGEAEKMFGYSRQELLGHPIEMLVPQRYHRAHVSDRSAYTADPRTRPMGAGRRLAGRRKDGSEFPVEISLSPFQTDQAPHR